MTIRIAFQLISLFLMISFPVGCSHTNGDLTTTKRHSPSYVVGGNSQDTVIVFVHGIFGDSYTTWQNKQGLYFWDLMKDDDIFKNSAVFAYGFPSPLLDGGFSIDQAVADMSLHLRNSHVLDHKQIIIVAHSMGGLVAERFLLTFQTAVGNKVPLLFLYSTPQEGAAITRVVTRVSRNPGVEQMLPGGNNQYLANLEQEWRQAQEDRRISTKIVCAYELQPTYGITIVDQLSGTRFCSGVSYPIDANHIDIVKPSSTGDKSYIALRMAVDDVLKNQHLKSESEVERRRIVLRSLRNEYILSHDGISPELAAGTAWPPLDWINDRLSKLGESWNVAYGRNVSELQFKDLPSKKASYLKDVTGNWKVQFIKGSTIINSSMNLKQIGPEVTGVIPTGDGTRGDLKGQYDGKVLTLSRETGMMGTVQRYSLEVKDSKRLEGTYWNEGPPQLQDKGIVTLSLD